MWCLIGVNKYASLILLSAFISKQLPKFGIYCQISYCTKRAGQGSGLGAAPQNVQDIKGSAANIQVSDANVTFGRNPEYRRGLGNLKLKRLLTIFTKGKWYPNAPRWIVRRDSTRNVARRFLSLRPRKEKRHQVHPNRNREVAKSMNSQLPTARSDTDLLVLDAETSNQTDQLKLRQQPAWAGKQDCHAAWWKQTATAKQT